MLSEHSSVTSADKAIARPHQSDVIIVNDYKYRIKRDGGSILVMRWLRDGFESSAERVLDKQEVPPRVSEAIKSF